MQQHQIPREHLTKSNFEVNDQNKENISLPSFILARKYRASYVCATDFPQQTYERQFLTG